MRSRDIWARRLRRRLEQAGFKVSVIDPSLAVGRKKSARVRDTQLIAQGNARPAEIQARNSIFGGRAKHFMIVDYGGLNQDK